MNYDEQVEKFREHNLEFDSAQEVKSFLETVNYYRFTGYLLQYRINQDSGELDSTKHPSFETARHIYDFDWELRCFLLRYLEIVEVYFRSLIAYELSRAVCVSVPYTQHYDFTTYSKPNKAKAIFDKVDAKIDRFKDSLIVQHHKAQYGGMYPVWVIVEMLSFTDLSKYYSSLPVGVKETIAKRNNTTVKTMGNYMHCLSVLRNKCAHAARLYNTRTNPVPAFSKRLLQARKDFKQDSLFAYIITVSKNLPTDEFKKSYIEEFSELIECYRDSIDMAIIGAPDDYLDFLTDHVKSKNELIVDNMKLREAREVEREKLEKERDEIKKELENERTSKQKEKEEILCVWKSRLQRIAKITYWLYYFLIALIPMGLIIAYIDYIKTNVRLYGGFFALGILLLLVTKAYEKIDRFVHTAAHKTAASIIKIIAPSQEMGDFFEAESQEK